MDWLGARQRGGSTRIESPLLLTAGRELSCAR